MKHILIPTVPSFLGANGLRTKHSEFRMGDGFYPPVDTEGTRAALMYICVFQTCCHDEESVGSI